MTSQMRRLLYLPCLAAVLIPGWVDAHGLHETNREIQAAQRPVTLWEWFFGRMEAAAHVRIDQAAGYRYIESDGLPDHATGRFPNRNNPNRIQRIEHTYRVPLEPTQNAREQDIGHAAFGVAINGVPYDPATAEFWQRDRRWNYEAIGGPYNLGLDSSNAHVQPNGAYHYHGIPKGLIDADGARRNPMLIGWAADGFPIYAPWGYRVAADETSGLVALRSSYRLKEGQRAGGPGGRYNGQFASDFEYRPGHGDLDKCNGRSGKTPEFPEGTYYYVLTGDFPFIPRCWVGVADASFRKGPGNGGNRSSPMDRGNAPRDGRRGPPQEALTACEGRASGTSCRFEAPHGEIDGQCRKVRDGSLACVPSGGPPR
ncbi:MAG: YHYH protein [Gammaproteobacteria bacterium]|nr:YHYH protein [Gammaproteobacteria bacterium]MCP5137466.1 YHYH protein [Gammaproteobacteria bacterium]